MAMVLDHNIVKTSQQSQDSNEKSPSMPGRASVRDGPLFAIDQDCDIALITEEVMWVPFVNCVCETCPTMC